MKKKFLTSQMENIWKKEEKYGRMHWNVLNPNFCIISDGMKKILLVSDASLRSTNGVVRAKKNIFQFLKKEKCEVLFLTPECFEQKKIISKKDGVFWISPFEYENFRKKVEEFSPDAVHIITEGSLGWMAKKWCKNNEKKFTTAFHTLHPYFMWIRYKIPKFLTFSYLRKFHEGSEKILCPSPHIARILQEKNFSSKTVVVPNGLNNEEFFPSQKPVLHSFPKPLLVFVGRVSPEKNVEAFLSLPVGGTKMVVGDGLSMQKLQKKFPSAVFVGEKRGEELLKIYQMADVFVAPSKTDTFGMTLLEALACGTPVAAFSTLGSEYIASVVKQGIFVSENLEESVQKALECAKNQEKKESFLREHFSLDEVGEKFLEEIMV